MIVVLFMFEGAEFPSVRTGHHRRFHPRGYRSPYPRGWTTRPHLALGTNHATLRMTPTSTAPALPTCSPTSARLVTAGSSPTLYTPLPRP